MKEIVYMDAAASWLKNQSVIESEVDFLANSYANAGRGVCERASNVDKMVANVRQSVADFIGAEPKNVVFTSGTTDGLNRIVNIIKNTESFDKKKPIVAVSDLDHHSARMPWQAVANDGLCDLVVCSLDSDFNIDVNNIPKCDVFVITAMSNAKLTVFEIDRGFISLIKQYFKSYEDKNKFFVVEGDVLKTWKKHLENNSIPQRFFGNLPYNVAATIIADTIENNVRFEKCVFTIQKEVALRMTAKPGTNDYSSFSILCQWAYDVKSIIDLNGNNFWPRPNVDSRSVLFTKKENFPACENPALFMKVMRSLFTSRRKTVRNNLQGYLKNNELTLRFLEEAKIDPMKRAEVLSLEEMLRLSDVINRGKND